MALADGGGALPQPNADELWIVAEVGRGASVGRPVQLAASSLVAADGHAWIEYAGMWVRCQRAKKGEQSIAVEQLLGTCERDVRSLSHLP